MTNATSENRPLSPHLQIYRPQITSVISILHRITGVALAGGALLITWWFFAAAAGPGYFAFIDGLMTSWLGLLVLFVFTFALWFHACTGVRHLVWDTGCGYDLQQVTTSGYMAVAVAAALTVLTWVVGL